MAHNDVAQFAGDVIDCQSTLPQCVVNFPKFGALGESIGDNQVSTCQKVGIEFLLVGGVAADGDDRRSWLYPVGRNQRLAAGCCGDDQVAFSHCLFNCS